MSPPLRDYQAKALYAVAHEGVSYLGLEQGLGKSRVMIELARISNMRRILVFCPASVRLVWSDEVAKWWPNGPQVIQVKKPADLATSAPGFYVMSYDVLSRRDDFVDAIRDSSADPFLYDAAFCDEAHYLKDLSANRTERFFKGVAPCARRTILASGTPAPNHAGELYAPLRFLAPEKITTSAGRVMTKMQFEDSFCKVDTKFFNGRSVRVIVGSQNTDALRHKLKGFMLRMRKTEVLKELPPLEFVTTPLDAAIPKSDLAALDGYRDILRDDMTDEQFMDVLRRSDEQMARLRVVLGLAKAGPAIDYTKDFLEGNDGKVILWAEHHGVIDMLAGGLAAYNPVKIDGRTSPKDRRAAVDTFLNAAACRVFVGNIKAAGTGLTLVGPNCRCSDCFFVESSYTPGDNLQAAARIHRLGQRDGVLARVFVAHRTIDDRIQAILTRKQNDLAAIFDSEGATA